MAAVTLDSIAKLIPEAVGGFFFQFRMDLCRYL